MGLVLLWIGGRYCLTEYEAGRWPTTPGIVTGSEVRVDTAGRRFSRPEVLYAYEVSGERHYSDRVTYTWVGIKDRKPTPEDVVATYPEGSRVTVHYNPDNPDEAVLEPDHFIPGLVVFGFGGFFLAGAVLAYRQAIAWPDPTSPPRAAA